MGRLADQFLLRGQPIAFHFCLHLSLHINQSQTLSQTLSIFIISAIATTIFRSPWYGLRACATSILSFINTSPSRQGKLTAVSQYTFRISSITESSIGEPSP